MTVRCLLLVCMLTCLETRAEEINISRELTKAVFAAQPGGVPMGVLQTASFCQADGSILDANGPRNMTNALFTCSLVFKDLLLTPIDVRYSDIKKAAIPTSIASKPFIYTNCTKKRLTIDDTLAIQTTEGLSYTKGTTLTLGEQASWNGNVKLTIGVAELGAGGAGEVSWSVQQTETSTTSREATTTTTLKLTVEVDPMTSREILLQKTLTKGYVDFVGTVAVEGDVMVRLRTRPDNRINDSSMNTKISTLITNQTGRVIKLAGQVWNVTGDDVTRKDSIKALKNYPNLCEAGTKALVRSEKSTVVIPASSPR